jgi:hypothetical protein
VRPRITKDDTLFWPFSRSAALLVEPDPSSAVLYCGTPTPGLKAQLMERLLEGCAD